MNKKSILSGLYILSFATLSYAMELEDHHYDSSPKKTWYDDTGRTEREKIYQRVIERYGPDHREVELKRQKMAAIAKGTASAVVGTVGGMVLLYGHDADFKV